MKTIAKEPHLKMIIKFHPACRYQVYEEWKSAIPKSWQKKSDICPMTHTVHMI